MFICATPFAYLLVTALTCISATIKCSEVPHYTVTVLLYQILPNRSFWLFQTSIAFNMKPWFNMTCQNCVSGFYHRGLEWGTAHMEATGDMATKKAKHQHAQTHTQTHMQTHTRTHTRQSLLFSSIGHQQDRIFMKLKKYCFSLCHCLWGSSSGRI